MSIRMKTETGDVILAGKGKDAVGDFIETPQTAEVGQALAVKAVDENSRPTEWETVDKGGARYVKVNTYIDGKSATIKVDDSWMTTNYINYPHYVTSCQISYFEQSTPHYGIGHIWIGYNSYGNIATAIQYYEYNSTNLKGLSDIANLTANSDFTELTISIKKNTVRNLVIKY